MALACEAGEAAGLGTGGSNPVRKRQEEQKGGGGVALLRVVCEEVASPFYLAMWRTASVGLLRGKGGLRRSDPELLAHA